ncbi:hypothetical protein [Chelatococcus reniformis]|uniref:Antifreeze protein n=1 Tax=Chelatococcus reniformis TaxID=1494448 RepID=A0A916XGK9_9HYPH|nr:hypothetical protein [Chelatococcus reniformis]GGC70331.1 hypothetical protein GCM10010994_31110 [Chelatococcus reniformis]
MKAFAALALLAPLALPMAAPSAQAQSIGIGRDGAPRVIIQRGDDGYAEPRARRYERHDQRYGERYNRRVDRYRGDPDTTGSIRNRRLRDDDDY